MKCNKINHHVKNYPSPTKVTKNLDSKNPNQDNTLQNLNGDCENTQSERTAKMSDPELSGVHLNSVSSSFKNEQEGRVTAVVAKAKYQKAIKNQARQRVECSARFCPSNEVIKDLQDSGSDGNLMFHEKGKPMHFLLD